MQLDYKLLRGIPLFKGIKESEYRALLSCVGAKTQRFEKSEFILLNGDKVNSIGIVLDGRVQIIKEDIFGNRAILNNLGVKGVFGESFICGGNYTLTVSVQAVENSDILFLPFERVMHICPSACGFHNALIKNMVELVARKNIRLMENLEITTKHSLREKILAYLSQLALEQGSTTVTSSLGRIDLADFLGADRSSLTRELNRMRNDGLISFDKNIYSLSKTQ